MTDAEHADLSRQLALALGYPAESVRVGHEKLGYADDDGCCVPYTSGCEVYGAGRIERPPLLECGDRSDVWTDFDYRDPAVWGALLKWLADEKFVRIVPGPVPSSWTAQTPQCDMEFNTLEEAIARAVIAVKEKA